MPLTEALSRGWGDRDPRFAMLLQQERAGVSIKAEPERLRGALARDGEGSTKCG